MLQLLALLLFCGMTLTFSSDRASAQNQCGWTEHYDFICGGGAGLPLNTQIFITLPPGFYNGPTGTGTPVFLNNLLNQLAQGTPTPNLGQILSDIRDILLYTREPQLQELMNLLSQDPPAGCPLLIGPAAAVIDRYAQMLDQQIQAAVNQPPAVQNAMTLATFATNPLVNLAIPSYVYNGGNTAQVLGENVQVPRCLP